MLSIENLVIDSLDYILIVDKDYRIVYNTRYDATLNMQSSEYKAKDIMHKYYFDVYPTLNREDSSVAKCIETGQIVVCKHQIFEDYTGKRFCSNNVTFPIMRLGELIAVVELSMDADENEDIATGGNKKFDEFIEKIRVDSGSVSFDTILSSDREMNLAKERGKMLAKLPNPVLIYGETGTGKELFAQAIISYSGVPKNKVVIQNCATVPENLMESILFGTVKGAYTGAENKSGLFEQADGGILFLDEIATIPYSVQAKLLRVIQDGTFRSLGDSKDKKVNVKIIGAMNVDPVHAIENKTLRADLFYRFSSGLITIPPLRERSNDINLFISYYIYFFGSMYGKKIQDISPEVRSLFLNYSWDGNVRELKNAMEYMVVSSNSSVLDIDLIPKYLMDKIEKEKTIAKELAENALLDYNKTETETYGKSFKNTLSNLFSNNENVPFTDIVDELEKTLIESALRAANGNKTKAADILGLPRQTMKYKIERLKIKC